MQSAINKLRERRRDGEEGFTLIELMVVVLIIAILLAIAIPTFLGARKRAQDRAAQSSLRNALTAAKTIYTDASSYTGAIAGAVGPPATGLTSVEPSLTFVADTAVTTTDGPKKVSVLPASDGASWSAAAMSKSGTCFWIKDVATSASSTAGAAPGTWFGTGGTCTATGAAAANLPEFP